MADTVNSLNDFVEIQVYVGESSEPIESTSYTEVQELFESHLKETFHDPSNLKQYGIDVYKIQVGDKIMISPSKWTLQFCKDKGVPLSDNYDFKYEVSNTRLEYYTKNPTKGIELPLLEIKIFLNRL